MMYGRNSLRLPTTRKKKDMTTFPAAQKIVISDVDGDLTIRGWDQQTIQVESDDEISRLRLQGDSLLVSDTDGSVALSVPYETIIVAKDINGNAMIENVRRVDLKDIENDATLQRIHGDVILADIGSVVSISEVRGTVQAKGIGSSAALNDIAGNVTLSDIGAEVTLSGINGSVTVKDIGDSAAIESVTGNVTVGDVGSDVSLSDIGGNVQLQDSSNDVVLTNIRGNVMLSDVSVNAALSEINGSVQAKDIGNDIVVKSVGGGVTLADIGTNAFLSGINGSVVVQDIGNDVSLENINGNVKVGDISNNADLKTIRGNVTLNDVGNDLALNDVYGNVQVASVGNDAQFSGLHGMLDANDIDGDLQLQADFPVGSRSRIRVDGDALVTLPEHANLSIQARVDGDIRGRSVVSNSSGSHSNILQLTYGNGGALLELQVGGDLTLLGNESPHSSSSSSGEPEWESFRHDMSNLGRDMERMSKDFAFGFSTAFDDTAASFNINIDEMKDAHKAAEQGRRAGEQARRRGEEMGRRANEQAARLNVRINDREWRLDPERINRIIEQAQRAAAEGIFGALEAVEQALSNLRMSIPPVMPSAPTPPTPPTPTTPTTPPEVPTPPTAPRNDDTVSGGVSAEGIQQEPSVSDAQPEQQATGEGANVASASVNVEQERLAILRMIAEGRITPDEGDLLLEALG